MRQRVGFARALVVDPNILLMDEPFSALDVLTAETLRTDFLELWGDGKLPIKGVIIVTHNIEEAVLMCDRILLFSSNPGRIIREIAVDLKQPRNRLDPQFRDQVEKIYVAMTARTPTPAKIDAPAGAVAATINMILPRVSANLLSGLVETLAGEPYLGKADLPVIADELHMEGDDLFPVSDALQMLHFVEVEGGDIKLTDTGKQFVDADTDGRKKIFERQLLAYVPLAAHIRRILQERANHLAPKSRFFDELEDHMSGEDVEATLRSVTAWARYAEAFAYDDDTQTFSLENPV
jgi:NitT/TauT family transport system ATP-binding protein